MRIDTLFLVLAIPFTLLGLFLITTTTLATVDDTLREGLGLFCILFGVVLLFDFAVSTVRNRETDIQRRTKRQQERTDELVKLRKRVREARRR